jgi:hypothetical protein
LHNDAQSFEWNVTFEQEGQILSGFAEMQGRVFPLEGWLDGNEITFYITIDQPDHDAPLMFAGEVDGGSATGVMDPTDGANPEAQMDWFGKKKDRREFGEANSPGHIC